MEATDNTIILKRAAQQAVKLLVSLNAQFKIILPSGEEFGELAVKRPEDTAALPLKRNLKYPMGSVREYALPFIANLKPGDVVHVPVGDFDLKTLQSNVSAYGTIHWGKGNYMTCVNNLHQSVEVFRVS